MKGRIFMIALSLTEVKDCMSKLLLKETFDSFLFIEGEVITSNTFRMDGYLQKAFFSKEDIPKTAYISWKEMREYWYFIIRGKHTPLSFQMILGLRESHIETLIQKHNLDFHSHDINGLFINIRFENGKLTCTTGTSVKLFTLDKSLEKTWDDFFLKFLNNHHIAYDLLA